MENTKKTVKLYTYKMALMNLNFKARQMSNDAISVYEKDMGIIENTPITLGINWAGCGTQSTEDAEKFAVTMIKVVNMVENFEYNGYTIDYSEDKAQEEAPKAEAKPVEKPAEKKEVKGITEKEEKVLRAIIAESNFNFNKVDLTKSWDEQVFESGYFEAFADTRDYGCGLSKQASRGVFGNLSKKGLITLSEDENGDGSPLTWIIINEKNFNNIKKVLG